MEPGCPGIPGVPGGPLTPGGPLAPGSPLFPLAPVPPGDPSPNNKVTNFKIYRKLATLEPIFRNGMSAILRKLNKQTSLLSVLLPPVNEVAGR